MITIIFHHMHVEPPKGFSRGKEYALRADVITGRPLAQNDNLEWIPMAACYNNQWVGMSGVLFFYVLEDFSIENLTDDELPMAWFNLGEDSEAFKYDGKLYYEMSILGGICVNPDW